MSFKLTTNLTPKGDQPQAIEKLDAELTKNTRDQILLGVTGSGKTFTLANIIERQQKPTLLISHNKTLAAQLFQEFRDFFKGNSVHYFVSYYDYYQPEAYIPQTDTYIEKDAKTNDEIDRLRHAATHAILTRNDVIIVASVSCIYGIGRPEIYKEAGFTIKKGDNLKQSILARALVKLQFERADYDPIPGTFRIKGEVFELMLPAGEGIVRIEYFGDTIERIIQTNTLFTSREGIEVDDVLIFPARHFVTEHSRMKEAIISIRKERNKHLKTLISHGKELEAHRLELRTSHDIEMLKGLGYVTGIENYSRHLDFRSPGEPPSTLIDFMNYAYGPKGWLLAIDESHMTIPQIKGMVLGDRARKETLVEHGFRLPSAIDNRPLAFNEFRNKTNQTIYMSATPGRFEMEELNPPITEQLIRPTGLLDPPISIHRSDDQLPHLIEEIKKRTANNERTLITTVTKRLAEELSEYLIEKDIAALYIHSDIDTLERPDLLRKLRSGDIDVLVGINLLREGLDLPEVSLVAILDADKEGFLRTKTTLIQTMGRAARHPKGEVFLYADKITNAMKDAIQETKRRRDTQQTYNKKHNITPTAIKKPIRDDVLTFRKNDKNKKRKEEEVLIKRTIRQKPETVEKRLMVWRKEMWEAADKLDFERASRLRDRIKQVSKEVL